MNPSAGADYVMTSSGLRPHCRCYCRPRRSNPMTPAQAQGRSIVTRQARTRVDYAYDPWQRNPWGMSGHGPQETPASPGFVENCQRHQSTETLHLCFVFVEYAQRAKVESRTRLAHRWPVVGGQCASDVMRRLSEDTIRAKILE